MARISQPTPRDTIIRCPTDTAPTIGGASAAPIVFCAPETAAGVRIEVVDLWSRVSGAWKGLS